MEISVKLVTGTNPKFDPATRRWGEGKCWRVVLDTQPPRIVLIPKFAVVGEVAPGDADILVEVIDCEWSREFFNEQFRLDLLHGEYA